MRELRILAVLAIIFHGIGLAVLPQLPSFYSQYTLELMRYAGHGARVNVNHPAMYALYVLPYPALLGVCFFQNWGRYLLLLFLGLILFGSFFFGTAISGPPETFVNLAATLLDGAIAGICFFSPLKKLFEKPDS
jgi:hypothetical protein